MAFRRLQVVSYLRNGKRLLLSAFENLLRSQLALVSVLLRPCDGPFQPTSCAQGYRHEVGFVDTLFYRLDKVGAVSVNAVGHNILDDWMNALLNFPGGAPVKYAPVRSSGPTG
jgi:hypothetical protein